MILVENCHKLFTKELTNTDQNFRLLIKTSCKQTDNTISSHKPLNGLCIQGVVVIYLQNLTPGSSQSAAVLTLNAQVNLLSFACDQNHTFQNFWIYPTPTTSGWKDLKNYINLIKYLHCDLEIKIVASTNTSLDAIFFSCEQMHNPLFCVVSRSPKQ